MDDDYDPPSIIDQIANEMADGPIIAGAISRTGKRPGDCKATAEAIPAVEARVKLYSERYAAGKRIFDAGDGPLFRDTDISRTPSFHRSQDASSPVETNETSILAHGVRAY